MSNQEKQQKKHDKERRRLERQRSRKRSKQLASMKKYVIVVGVALLLIYGLTQMFSGPQIGPIGSTHEHVDFLIYIDGQPMDLNQSQYAMKSQYAHIHFGEGDLIHLHAINIPLSWFMDELDLPITENSIDIHGNVYSNDGEKTFKIFLNGEELNDIDYPISDEDKILIYYGSESDVEAALDLVPDRAIEINNMPNRGD